MLHIPLDKLLVLKLGSLRRLAAKLDLSLKMKTSQIKNILSKLTTSPSKWELDTIVYNDRYSNPKTLAAFLTRIQDLEALQSNDGQQELSYLLEMLEDLEEEDCLELINQSEDDAKNSFIENLARTSAIEILTGGKIDFDSMNTACKLSPNDFILCAKRTQDLINAIQGLVVKGETLSMDVAGT